MKSSQGKLVKPEVVWIFSCKKLLPDEFKMSLCGHKIISYENDKSYHVQVIRCPQSDQWQGSDESQSIHPKHFDDVNTYCCYTLQYNLLMLESPPTTFQGGLVCASFPSLLMKGELLPNHSAVGNFGALFNFILSRLIMKNSSDKGS